MLILFYHHLLLLFIAPLFWGGTSPPFIRWSGPDAHPRFKGEDKSQVWKSVCHVTVIVSVMYSGLQLAQGESSPGPLLELLGRGLVFLCGGCQIDQKTSTSGSFCVCVCAHVRVRKYLAFVRGKNKDQRKQVKEMEQVR